MITFEQIRQAFPDGEMKGKEWFALCPHCSKHALAIKPGDDAPVVAYCMHCQKDYTGEAIKRLPQNGSRPNASTPAAAPANHESGWAYSTEKAKAAARHIEKASEFLKGRGISLDVARKRQLGVEVIGGKEFLVLPTFFDGDLVAAKLRNLNPIAKNDKWRKWKRDDRVFWLFNREAAETAPVFSNLYILESELDSLTAETAGYYGVSVDSAQHKLNAPDLELLQKTQATLIFGPDRDGAGLTCAANLAGALGLDSTASIRWPKKDLGELYAANPAGFCESLDKLTIAVQPLWRLRFRTIGELEDGDPEQPIRNILIEGVNFLGSLSGVGKTWLALAMVKALVYGQQFLNVWDVPRKRNVLYLVPEMGDRALRQRAEKLGLPLDNGLYVWTVRDGSIRLNDPMLLQAVQEIQPVIFLDTAIRFSEAESENDSRENAGGLATQLFDLRRAGADCIVCLHHSPKAQGDANFMKLENVLRGSGEFGAMADVVWGIQHARKRKGNNNWDDEYVLESMNMTRLYVQCVKPRDLPAADPFIVQGRPYIDDTGNLAVIASDAQVGEADASKVSDTAADRAEALARQNPTISKSAIAKETGISRNRIEEVLAGRGMKYVSTSGREGRWEDGPKDGSDAPF